MKNLTQKIGTLFIAALLVMATGGFSIYEHFCRCAGESSASIFLEASCEHNNPQSAAACCQHETIPSCCMDKPPDHQGNACEHDDCCQDSETFLKISDNFTTSLDKISFKFIPGIIQVLIANDLLADPQAFISPLPEFYDTSPPLYGRELVNHLHQLKLGYFLV